MECKNTKNRKDITARSIRIVNEEDKKKKQSAAAADMQY